MGLSDRDYARPIPPPKLGGQGVGRMRMISVNTWLIIVNVIVFVLANVIFGGTLYKTTAGRFIDTAAPKQAVERAQVDRSLALSYPYEPGYFYHPLIDPQTVAVDRAGNPQRDLQTGKLMYREVGGDRFAMRPVLHALGHFSTGKAFLEFQVWRFITFQFLHADAFHLLFNMLGLWFVGGLVEEYLGRRRYLAFYLVCGLFGAVAYLILNFLGYVLITHVSPGLRGSVPAVLFDDIYTPLVGASAGVFGVLMASARIAPSAIVDVLLVIPMKLRTAVYIFLLLAFLNLLRGGTNAGGDAAHVGGALAGAFFIRRTYLLRDFFDILSDSRKVPPKRPEETAADRILDKVRAEGLESLTPAERETLRRATEAARRD